MSEWSPARKLQELENHLDALRVCRRCPRMIPPVVVGRPVMSKILLVGQAPGVKEPVLGRPFAWTAGKTLFGWLSAATGWTEDEARESIYFAAVCRCFPGKNPKGGDRVPDRSEIAACVDWLAAEIRLLQPELVLAVGKLAISQFVTFDKLTEVVGSVVSIQTSGHRCDLIPLPHPSGASTWHRMEPGRTLLASALSQIASHPTVMRVNSGSKCPD